MSNSIRKYFDNVDKVDIQANNEGFQLFDDNLCFCYGYQGYQHITRGQKAKKIRSMHPIMHRQYRKTMLFKQKQGLFKSKEDGLEKVLWKTYWITSSYLFDS